MKTSVHKIFRIWDVTAAQDGSGQSLSAQVFSNLSLLFQENVEYKRYGTLEQDQFLLDGQHQCFPDIPAKENFGLWSAALSSQSGHFEENPVLAVNFTERHSSVGITLHFDEHDLDYCSEVSVQWFNGTERLKSAAFSPDRPVFFCQAHVEDYTKIEVAFIKTSKPYRYAKLNRIDFGQSLPILAKDIISSKVLEEVNPISAEISINTLNFKIYSENEDFSLVNPDGVYEFLQKKQRVDVYETLGEETIYMGAYYLDEPENENARVISMQCVDMLGIIDQTTFYGGMYKDAPVMDLFDQIAASAGAGVVFDVKGFEDVTVSGYLPICTHREAVQQIAFAIGAAVNCARSYAIKVYPLPVEKNREIDYDRKIDNHKVKQTELVTSVAVTAHEYVQNSDALTLFNAALEPGTHQVAFSQPAHSLGVAGGRMLRSSANHGVVEVANAGTVVITGRGYDDNQQQVRAALASIPANERANEISVADATLVNPAKAMTVAQRVLEHYQNRLESTGSIVLGAEEAGEIMDMKTMSDQTIRGRIESLDIDLAGGFIAKAVMKGRTVKE